MFEDSLIESGGRLKTTRGVYDFSVVCVRGRYGWSYGSDSPDVHGSFPNAQLMISWLLRRPRHHHLRPRLPQFTS